MSDRGAILLGPQLAEGIETLENSESHRHWIPEEDCPFVGCYRRFTIEGFASVWGLGAYNIPPTASARIQLGYFGRLVRSIKYQNPLRDREDARIAVTSAQLSRFVDNMVQGHFNGLALTPANRDSSRSILPYIASVLIKVGLADRILDVHRNANTPVMKSIKDTDRSSLFLKRQAALAGKYEIPRVPVSRAKERFLVLDDVLDTGATMSAMGAAILVKHPNAELHGVALTYLRDPRIHT